MLATSIRPFTRFSVAEIGVRLAMASILTLAVVAGLTLTAEPAQAVVPGAVGKIAFTRFDGGNADIYVMNADGSAQTQLTTDPSGDSEAVWSPDGQKLAFVSWRDGQAEIYVMNADGSGQTRLTNNPADDRVPTWSPDGLRLAFSTDRDGEYSIYVMNADGSGQTALTAATKDYTPDWSPDGSKILFHSNRTGLPEIYVMNADGSGQTALTSDGQVNGVANWSPDGRKIAFHSYRDGQADIFVMNADGTGLTRITDNPAGDTGVTWSPDGRRLAFVSGRDGPFGIYTVNADGTGPVDRLTSFAGGDSNPDWQSIPSADLAVALAATPANAQANKPLTYTITVSNRGPSKAKGVVVTDTLPAGSRFVSASSSQGSCTAPPVGSTGTLTCSMGSIASGSASSATLVVKVVVKKTTLANTVTVTASTSDPNTANNSVTATTQVR